MIRVPARARKLFGQGRLIGLLLLVVRAFASPALPDPAPEDDLASMEMEMTFADLAVVDRRLQRVEASLKSAKTSEREAVQKEMELLGRIKAALEAVQANEMVAFAKSQVAEQRAMDVDPRKVGRGIADQIALMRSWAASSRALRTLGRSIVIHATWPRSSRPTPSTKPTRSGTPDT